MWTGNLNSFHFAKKNAANVHEKKDEKLKF